LVSDAGTPTISDPGTALVNEVRAAGGTVVAVPGPSAVAAALSISGFPADRYIFLGFLPRKGGDRRRFLDQVAQSPWTVVLFESPERLGTLLEALIKACGGDRGAAVAREMTKVHEELRIGTLSELEVYYRERPARGEITVLVRGGDPVEVAPSQDEAVTNAGLWLSQGISRRDVVTRLVSEFGLSRNEAYRMVTAL
jgi:16S rRNA (cytidine1402-2'-O)-methyltransferase